jgi:hypothetical protein
MTCWDQGKANAVARSTRNGAFSELTTDMSGEAVAPGADQVPCFEDAGDRGARLQHDLPLKMRRRIQDRGDVTRAPDTARHWRGRHM